MREKPTSISYPCNPGPWPLRARWSGCGVSPWVAAYRHGSSPGTHVTGAAGALRPRATTAAVWQPHPIAGERSDHAAPFASPTRAALPTNAPGSCHRASEAAPGWTVVSHITAQAYLGRDVSASRGEGDSGSSGRGSKSAASGRRAAAVGGGDGNAAAIPTTCPMPTCGSQQINHDGGVV